MRVAVLTGLFAFSLVVVISSHKVDAQAPDLLAIKSIQTVSTVSQEFNALAVIESKTVEAADAKKPVPIPEPKVHTIGPDESLSTIAKQYDTTWVRLFNKNAGIADPNIIVVGEVITIPLSEEQLTDRPLPTPPVVARAPETPTLSTTNKAKPTRTTATTTLSRGTSSGNTYAYGYCTWYAKNMRPDLPNNLGNADTWVARAAAQGIPTGAAPRAGAIGQQGMHVVYVQSVNGDGTVTISEMNYRGFNVISTRTVAASNFRYIY